MIKTVPMYVAVCDRCELDADYDEYAGFCDEETAVLMATERDFGNEWVEIGGRLLCSDCWQFDEDGDKIERPAEDVA